MFKEKINIHSKTNARAKAARIGILEIFSSQLCREWSGRCTPAQTPACACEASFSGCTCCIRTCTGVLSLLQYSCSVCSWTCAWILCSSSVSLCFVGCQLFVNYLLWRVLSVSVVKEKRQAEPALCLHYLC